MSKVKLYAISVFCYKIKKKINGPNNYENPMLWNDQGK